MDAWEAVAVQVFHDWVPGGGPETWRTTESIFLTPIEKTVTIPNPDHAPLGKYEVAD